MKDLFCSIPFGDFHMFTLFVTRHDSLYFILKLSYFVHNFVKLLFVMKSEHILFDINATATKIPSQ